MSVTVTRDPVLELKRSFARGWRGLMEHYQHLSKTRPPLPAIAVIGGPVAGRALEVSPFLDALWLHRCTKVRDPLAHPRAHADEEELDELGALDEHELDALDEEPFPSVVLTAEYPDTPCVAELLGAYIPLVTTCPHGSDLELWLVWRGWKGVTPDLAQWN